MPTDANAFGPPRLRLDFIPRVLEVEIRRIPYEPPKIRYFESSRAGYEEAIAFTLRTRGRFAERALSPILFVGDVPISEFRTLETDDEDGTSLYQFLAFETERLEKGAPLSLAWPESPEKRLKTPFVFTLEKRSPEQDD